MAVSRSSSAEKVFQEDHYTNFGLNLRHTKHPLISKCFPKYFPKFLHMFIFFRYFSVGKVFKEDYNTNSGQTLRHTKNPFFHIFPKNFLVNILYLTSLI